jgi:hypothetical protein
MRGEPLAQRPQSSAKPSGALCRMTPVLLDMFHALRRKGLDEIPILWKDTGCLPSADAPVSGPDGYRAGYLLCLAHSALTWGAAGATEKFRETVCEEEVARRAERWLGRPQRGRPPSTRAGQTRRYLGVLLDLAKVLPSTPLGAYSSPLGTALLRPRPVRSVGRPLGPSTNTVVRVWCIESLRQLSKLPLATAIRLLNSRVPGLAYSEVPESGARDTGADFNTRFRVERRRVRLYLLGNKS